MCLKTLSKCGGPLWALPYPPASGSAQVVSVFLTFFWHVQWERNHAFTAWHGKKREKGYLRWRLKHRAFSTCGSSAQTSGVALRNYSANPKAWNAGHKTLRKGGVVPSASPGSTDLSGTNPGMCPQEGPCPQLQRGGRSHPGHGVCVRVVPGDSSAQCPGRSTDSAWINLHLCGLVLFSVPEQHSIPLHTGPALFKYSSSA